MGPEFNALWDTYFKDKPDKPVMLVVVSLSSFLVLTAVVKGSDRSCLLVCFPCSNRFDHQILDSCNFVSVRRPHLAAAWEVYDDVRVSFG